MQLAKRVFPVLLLLGIFVAGFFLVRAVFFSNQRISLPDQSATPKQLQQVTIPLVQAPDFAIPTTGWSILDTATDKVVIRKEVDDTNVWNWDDHLIYLDGSKIFAYPLSEVSEGVEAVTPVSLYSLPAGLLNSNISVDSSDNTLRISVTDSDRQTRNLKFAAVGALPVEVDQGVQTSYMELRESQWKTNNSGNECGARTIFLRTNPTTGQDESVFDSNVGCYEGSELLGFTEPSTPLLTTHTTKNSKPLYSDLYLLKTNQGNQKEVLLSASEFPDNITHLDFQPGLDRVYLFGSEVYAYHMDTGQLIKEFEFPQAGSRFGNLFSSRDLTYKAIYSGADSMCIVVEDGSNAGTTYQLSLNTASGEISTVDDCKTSVQNVAGFYSSVSQAFAQLNLPERFVLEIKE